MPSSADPQAPAAAPEDAVLVLDTRAEAGRLRLRDLGRVERRLLFRASCAHIEIRVGASPAEEGEPVWLFGQYIGTGVAGDDHRARPANGAAATARCAPVTVAIVGPVGAAEETSVSAAGDFALPCDPRRPFWLEFRAERAAPVRARFDP